MPKISVLVRSYNHERFLVQSIGSVLGQTFRDLEIIVIDDASSDGSVEMIRAIPDDRLRLLVHGQRRGGTATLNECVALATGEYLAVQNTDDVWAPEKLERQVAVLERRPEVAAVFTGADFIDEDGRALTDHGYVQFTTKNQSRREWLRRFFLRGNCLCHPSSVVRRSVLDEVGRYNEALSSLPDLDLWIRVCLRHELHVVDANGVQLRLRGDGGNVSAPTPVNLIRHGFEASRILDRYLSIESVSELLAVFPEATAYGPVLPGATPYFLARIALDTGHRPHWHWGLEVLYRLLQDKDAAATLERQYGLTPLEFGRLTSEKDFARVHAELAVGGGPTGLSPGFTRDRDSLLASPIVDRRGGLQDRAGGKLHNMRAELGRLLGAGHERLERLWRER